MSDEKKEDDSGALTSPYRQRMRLAVLYTLLSRPLTLVAMGTSLAALARLISPEEFGLFAIAYAVHATLEQVALFGLKPFLIRQKNLGRRDLERAAGLSIAIGAGLLLLIVAGHQLVPSDLTDDGLGKALLILGTTMIVRPISLVSETLLEKHLRFGRVSAITVLSSVSYALVAIFAALQGFGVVALALGVLGEQVIRTLALLVAGPEGRVLPRIGSLPAFGGFGWSYTASRMLPKLSGFAVVTGLADLIGVAAVGLYNRAQTIVKLADKTVMSAVDPVVLPALSHSINEGGDPQDAYDRKVGYLTAFLWPVFAAMIILTGPLVRTLLGEDWLETITPARILLVGALAFPFTQMSLKLFVVFDLVPQYLPIQTANQVMRVLLALSGGMIGLSYACAGLALAGFIKAGLITYALHRHLGMGWRKSLAPMLPAAGVALMTAAGSSVGLLLPGSEPLLQLVAGMLGAFALWVAGLFLMGHPLTVDAGDLWRQRKQIIVRLAPTSQPRSAP
jgi:O-antigen/teichoic acid export membrane protein